MRIREAIESLRARGENPSVQAVRREIGRGSMTTILRLMQEMQSAELGGAQQEEAGREAAFLQGGGIGRAGVSGDRPEEVPSRQQAERVSAASALPSPLVESGGTAEDRRALLRQIERLTEATLLLARKLV